MNALVAAQAQLPLFDAGRREPPAFEVRISRRARRLTVRVYPGGRVEVTVPLGTRPQVVERFVARHRRWIDERVADFRLRTPAALQPLPTLVQLRALDEQWHVEWVPRARAGWEIVGTDRLVVYGDPADPVACRHRLRDWLLDQGDRGLRPWLEALAAEHGFAFSRTQIRRQRTRWGSCSRSGTISLNVSLLFQPPPVVRYLFVHELCHTQHMNHSERFWRLVERHEPDWRALDAELLKGWRHVPDWVYA